MKNQQVRKSVFETNSSSSHAFAMGRGDVVSMPFSKEVLTEGIFTVYQNDYGWEWYRYYSSPEKIRYLVTLVLNGNSYRESVSGENTYLNMLSKVVKEHTGVILQYDAFSKGGIDHQSSINENGRVMGVFDSERLLKSFLFDDTAYIQTGNDNESMPMVVGSDKGPIKAYAEHHALVPKEYVPVKLKLLSGFEDLIELSNGAVLSATCMNKELMAEVLQDGVITWCEATLYHVKGERAHEYSGDKKIESYLGKALSLSFKISESIGFSYKSEAIDKDEGFRQSSAEWTVAVPPSLRDALMALSPVAPELCQLANHICWAEDVAINTGDFYTVKERIKKLKEIAKNFDKVATSGLLAQLMLETKGLN